MKVLVSDNLGEEGIKIFKNEEGIEVDVKTGLSPEELKKIIGDYDALAIRSATKVTEDILEAGKKLKVVGRAGIGLDNVDIPAATKRGIAVMNTPGGNVVTTAEHAISLMMSLTRNIPQATASLKAGQWEKKKFQGRELFNKTLGVIGYGNIGTIVCDRARGLKMNVIVYDPLVTAEVIEKAGYESVSLETLYKRSDYITIHVPKLKQTVGLINKEAIDQMKKGVMIINAARGGIVDEKALYDGLKSGKIAGAALDVFETEPPKNSPLFELENLIGTPHLGASTLEAQTNVAVSVAEQIIAYLKHNTVINAVNVPSVTGELLEKLKPYLFIADRMGAMQAQLVSGPLEEVTIEYMGNFQGLDLAPVTTAAIKGLLSPIVTDEVNSVNAPVMAKKMGIAITETKSDDANEFNNLITIKVKTPQKESLVSGTIFGKNDPKIVRINNFRLEVQPKGHLALIYNKNQPGAIGKIGTALGELNINIAQMTVGRREVDGAENIILLTTDQAMDQKAVDVLSGIPLVNAVIPLEL